jgi:predicted nucleotidyltransferase
VEILGIIAEYNPFHNGHLYHLQKAKELTGAKYCVAVMGGHFLQRGEPAFINKWTRTLMALNAGIDIVIEMPFIFASQDARGFAKAGIQILNSLGIVDYIVFGSENNQLEILNNLAEILRTEPDYYKKVLKEEIKNGISFPKIRERAVIQYYQKYGNNCNRNTINNIKRVLRQPNNILALEYLISLKNIKSSITPIAIKRVGSNYLQEQLEGQYSSATAIRKIILKNYSKKQKNPLKGIEKTLPVFSYELILDDIKKGLNPITLSSFEQAIFSQLRRMPVNEIKMIHGVQEGLENRLKYGVNYSFNIETLIQKVKSKRYTQTRIQRILIHSLFDLTHKEIEIFNQKGPLYCRILGMTENGKLILKKLKKHSRLPIIIKMRNFLREIHNNEDNMIQKMLNYDILSTDLYVLGYNLDIARIAGQDFTNNIIILNKYK